MKSESSTDRYYFVEFKPNANYFCAFMDFTSNRSDKCNHLYAVENTIRWNMVLQTDKKLPISQTKRNTTTVADQYKNETIRNLNILEKVEIEAESYNDPAPILGNR